MNKFNGHRNQIEFFVRFKADRSLKCSQYDPYVNSAQQVENIVFVGL